MRGNRRFNVELCLKRMNGIVLGPGDEFSFNGMIGERKKTDGFKESVVFKRQADGEIDEDWETGGGICQLATTLFNTAVLADMHITERSNHSKVVSYARIARDATVYWNAADLKFVNTMTHPVMVWGEMNGYDLVITMVGDRSDKYDVEETSASWAGRAGEGGTLWRTVKRPTGEVVKAREWICDSFYPYG
jgi:vancomycin resistance protein YoaR